MSTHIAIIIGAIIVALGVLGGLKGGHSAAHYELVSAGDNVLRLDTRTGEVANCTTKWTENPALPSSDLTEKTWVCEKLIYPRGSR